MKFSMVQHAGEHEVFARIAFDSQIGESITLNLNHYHQTGTLVAATVSPDGKSVELTLEVDDLSMVAGFVREGFQPGAFGRGGKIPPAFPAPSTP